MVQLHSSTQVYNSIPIYSSIPISLEPTQIPPESPLSPGEDLQEHLVCSLDDKHVSKNYTSTCLKIALAVGTAFIAGRFFSRWVPIFPENDTTKPVVKTFQCTPNIPSVDTDYVDRIHAEIITPQEDAYGCIAKPYMYKDSIYVVNPTGAMCMEGVNLFGLIHMIPTEKIIIPSTNEESSSLEILFRQQSGQSNLDTVNVGKDTLRAALEEAVACRDGSNTYKVSINPKTNNQDTHPGNSLTH